MLGLRCTTRGGGRLAAGAAIRCFEYVDADNWSLDGVLRKRGLTIVFEGRAGCSCKFSLEAEGRGRRENLGIPDGLGLLMVVLSMIAIVPEHTELCSAIDRTLPELLEFSKGQR